MSSVRSEYDHPRSLSLCYGTKYQHVAAIPQHAVYKYSRSDLLKPPATDQTVTPVFRRSILDDRPNLNLCLVAWKTYERSAKNGRLKMVVHTSALLHA